MISDNEYFLSHETLSAHQWRGIKDLANAIDRFEPLAKRGRLGQTVVDQLVALGLAEKGVPPEAYLALGYETGYRLSPLGWQVLDRGQHPVARKR